MANLPSEVGSILRESIAAIEIVSMFSIGVYNALETVIIIFHIAKNYCSLYFWSMQVASWGNFFECLSCYRLLPILRTQSAMSIPFTIPLIYCYGQAASLNFNPRADLKLVNSLL
jgi:hypothetical protein